jgi:hypothetical protein
MAPFEKTTSVPRECGERIADPPGPMRMLSPANDDLGVMKCGPSGMRGCDPESRTPENG